MRLVLIVEARADAVSAGQLADRVLIACGPEWVTEDAIEDLRRWTGLDTDTPFTTWHDLKKQHAKSYSVKSHRGKWRLDYTANRGPDYTAARRALIVAVEIANDRKAPIGALVLIRDLDNQPERRTGLEAARKEMAPKLGFPIMIGTPNPEREAWILNGFEAKSDSESRRLEQVTNRLGFDPTQQPHRLRGDKRRSDQEAGRDIKQVLRSWSLRSRSGNRLACRIHRSRYWSTGVEKRDSPLSSGKCIPGSCPCSIRHRLNPATP